MFHLISWKSGPRTQLSSGRSQQRMLSVRGIDIKLSTWQQENPVTEFEVTLVSSPWEEGYRPPNVEKTPAIVVQTRIPYQRDSATTRASCTDVSDPGDRNVPEVGGFQDGYRCRSIVDAISSPEVSSCDAEVRRKRSALQTTSATPICSVTSRLPSAVARHR